MIIKKFKEWKDKSKAVFLGLGTVGIVAIVSAVFIVSSSNKNTNDEDAANNSISQYGRTSETGDTFNINENDTQAISSFNESVEEESLLKEEGFPKINTLMTRYLNAKLISSEETFQGLVSDPSKIDYERLHRKVEYIVSYQNIKSYVAEGIDEVDYVVYLTYDIELPEIKTLAPSIDEIYVTLDENNNPKVYLGELSKESIKYFNDLRESEEVTALIEDISNKFDYAIKSDDNLKDFYNSFSVTENEG